ncbi:Oxysterol-binding protein-related protein 6 [Bagarius yarrelli]|uniref:Oxysterol-binding protein-related protein 6 n=1 Tax=Bagarius yarrelli TaxID=175774 RepID=A0A556U8Q9_BAGYA|nr:Oxysterol-binding protein-related protein 6 [Bagarius yarrelli]
MDLEEQTVSSVTEKTSLSVSHLPRSPSKGGWQIMESLREPNGNVQKPSKHEGFLLKRRKWPMKGWHKMKKGKLRGRIDIGLSVMSIKKKTMCIDLDAEDSIYHLKVKSRDQFDGWVSQLRNHRTFRQNEIVMDPQERHLRSDSALRRQAVLSKQPSVPSKNSWFHSSEDMRKCCRELSECESSLLELNLLLKNMEVLHRKVSFPAVNTLQTEGPKKEKKGGRRWRSRKNRKSRKNTMQAPDSTSTASLHVSNPNLAPSELSHPESHLETPDSPTDALHLQEEFCSLASTVCATLKSTYTSLCIERDRVICINDKDLTDRPQHRLQQVSNKIGGSMPESLSEFYDAKEYLLSSSSSENEVSDNDSCLSDVSDNVSVELCNSETRLEKDNLDRSMLPRRLRLPSACVSVGVNLWSILSANIGKDLSKVAMPVQLNEPVNTLQRLCEEMEYCHLLDTAAHTQDPHMRMLNRVTSCIHNILSGERWIEHYGEMTLKNTASAENTSVCKVTFLKSKSRCLNTNDVEVVVTDSEGQVVHSLFGKWNEALYLGDPPSAICIWRVNPLPEDYQQYYGFTQFTVELNELNESIRPFLPPTDTRFRPDQRLLEEGDVAGAEEQKDRIESLQRERRRLLQETNTTHTPRFFNWSEDDAWISNGTYWPLREDPGFSKLEFPVLW